MEQHIETELSVAAAAKIACMSYYHFCRLFKKVIGKTFVEYQNFIRIRRAEKLLITTDRPLPISPLRLALDRWLILIEYLRRKLGKPRQIIGRK